MLTSMESQRLLDITLGRGLEGGGQEGDGEKVFCVLGISAEEKPSLAMYGRQISLPLAFLFLLFI